MSEVAFVPPPKPLELALPKVLFWRVLIQPYESPKKVGMIELPDEVRRNTDLLAVVGKVLDMGTLAFTAKTRSGLDYSHEIRQPQIGDWVMYGTYAGQRVRTADGRNLIILADDEILGVVERPEQYVFLV